MSDKCQQETKIFCEFNSFKHTEGLQPHRCRSKRDDDPHNQRAWKFAGQKGHCMQINVHKSLIFFIGLKPNVIQNVIQWS